MIAYHGTIIGNIDILRPFASPHSNLKYPCVYLSTNKALSAIYIWNQPYKWMTFEIQEDGLQSTTNHLKMGYMNSITESKAISILANLILMLTLIQT